MLTGVEPVSTGAVTAVDRCGSVSSLVSSGADCFGEPKGQRIPGASRAVQISSELTLPKQNDARAPLPLRHANSKSAVTQTAMVMMQALRGFRRWSQPAVRHGVHKHGFRSYPQRWRALGDTLSKGTRAYHIHTVVNPSSTTYSVVEQDGL